MFWDTTIILLIPALIFAMYAQAQVQITFSKYARVRNRYGYTAEEVARKILDSMGLYDVRIERIPGDLTDHYDPRAKVLRLSESVYGSESIAAIGVAAHEAGHAIQHARGYVPLTLRNSLVPVANLGANLAWPLVILGFFMGAPGLHLINIGIILFSAAVLFQIITLPVEFDASNRAIALLQSNVLFTRDDIEPATKVLRAAALTYVAAALVSIMQLIRLLIIRNNRE
ncbi:putative Zn-dependent protease [Thermoanaerobacter kivui]|uniref:Putative Zn-dependent protease n=1 Tax=Thermoanaerobacter kivui TaxID=2325 RepID=A0A097AS06_THEKI|nr:zinc metallopeptidase [Thermoanaerobacter kivui]AIS52589.1 putative Zn-dependent protease [Thermoanaerobacter kivui]